MAEVEFTPRQLETLPIVEVLEEVTRVSKKRKVPLAERIEYLQRLFTAFMDKSQAELDRWAAQAGVISFHAARVTSFRTALKVAIDAEEAAQGTLRTARQMPDGPARDAAIAAAITSLQSAQTALQVAQRESRLAVRDRFRLTPEAELPPAGP